MAPLCYLGVMYTVEKEKAYQREWRRRPENRERLKAKAAAFYRTVDGRSYSLWSAAKHRARKANVPFVLAWQDVKALLVAALDARYVAINAGGHMSPSLDRIHPPDGYVLGNVQIVPFWYNMAKNKFKQADILEAVRAFASTL